MSKTVELLKKFVTHYDKPQEDSATEDAAWSDLITCSTYWSRLTQTSFEDEELKRYFKTLPLDEREKYFLFGITCLNHFVQANFTGPDLPEEVEKFLLSDILKNIAFDKILSLNNDELNVNTKFVCLLVAARCIFKNCDIDKVLSLWWLWRYTLIHQSILEELNPPLLLIADHIESSIDKLEIADDYLKAKFLIERAQLHNLYRNVTKAEICIESACDILGLKYELIGKMGKRTKFQQFETSQLALEVTLLEKENIQRPSVQTTTVPKNVSLGDETRLDTVQFTDGDDTVKLLPTTEQQLLLTIIQHMIIAKPRDDLYYEELQPFIELILGQNSSWTVQVTALLLRCQLECKHKRTIERSFLQCGDIFKHMKIADPHPSGRVGLVYGCGLQAVWKTQAQLADLMLSLGMVKESLRIYLALQLWQEVIVCYTLLKMKHKAAKIITDQIRKKKTVKLLCLLGDMIDNENCYEEAWDLSKHRSSLAQRHWGQFFYSSKKYVECIPHFEKSLSINPLQSIVWLRLGYAALETENWQTAATAYRRYTTLEPGSFEAWNNLAKAYIKLGNKRSAYQALVDSLKCNYENWKVWDNMLVLSVDVNHFSDTIRAYHRILDIKEKHLDLEVLVTLIYAVVNNLNDHEGNPSSHLMDKVQQLLGRLTALYPGEGQLWEQYASIASTPLLKGQRLLRAYRCYTQSGWDKDLTSCQQVLLVCKKLADIGLNKSIDESDTFLNSVRLNLSSALAVMKRQDLDESKVMLDIVTGLLADVLQKVKKGE